MDEKRKFVRFSDTTLLYAPVELNPLPPFFGEKLKGNLINLSKGGMAILIAKEIPLGTRLHLKMTFPDHSQVESDVQIQHVSLKDKRYMIGIEFLNLPDYMGNKFAKMALDYQICEKRIERKDPNVCRLECAFYVICRKPQKVGSEDEMKERLLIHLKTLQEEEKT